VRRFEIYFLLSMLTGGLAAIVDKAGGGITWVLNPDKEKN
jgi:hypothetical protein